jgi:hypothetical protein
VALKFERPQQTAAHADAHREAGAKGSEIPGEHGQAGPGDLHQERCSKRRPGLSIAFPSLLPQMRDVRPIVPTIDCFDLVLIVLDEERLPRHLLFLGLDVLVEGQARSRRRR